MNRKFSAWQTIFFIWIGWVLVVIGFQAISTMRIKPVWPDRALEWTTNETGANYQKNRPFLLDKFMNNQVAWDSEYYLGIAVGGYDDARMPSLDRQGQKLSLAYAFFPFYPFMIRLLAFPLQVLGLGPIATATLAGVIVSALGTLAGMLALYDMTKDLLDENAALRAVFYLIIFPTAFFMTQVYTEGLFVGLSFSSLALLRRGKWVQAALLGALATLTRAVGVTLVVPMAIEWFRSNEWYQLDLEWRQIYHQGIPWKPLGKALLAFTPLIAFLIWKFSYLGFAFDVIESEFFGRGFMNIGGSFYNWADAFRSMLTLKNPQHSAYYFTEFLGLFVGLIAIVRCFNINSELAWFSLAVFLVSWGSGPAQGIHRYVLAAPALFIALAAWGENPVFDRVWTIASILIMGLLSMLYAFNMWVA